MSVSQQFLLEGAVFALERAGELLRDATLLYQNKSYPSAVVMALFAREELGRWVLLRDLRKKVLEGKQVTFEDVKNHFSDHPKKQEAGMRSLVTRTTKDTQLGKLLTAGQQALTDAQYDEFKAIDKKIEDIDRRWKNRLPHDRHKQRQLALYVDSKPSNEWSRPSKEISQDTAYSVINDAINDFNVTLDNNYTSLELLQASDREFYDALMKWTDRPTIPQVKWLSSPGS